MEYFDAVVVCNGHYNVPFEPSLPGLESFTGMFFFGSMLCVMQYMRPINVSMRPEGLFLDQQHFTFFSSQMFSCKTPECERFRNYGRNLGIPPKVWEFFPQPFAQEFHLMKSKFEFFFLCFELMLSTGAQYLQ